MRRLRALWRRRHCIRGHRPDWPQAILLALSTPNCIGCGVRITSLAPDEEMGVLCVEDPDIAW